MRTTLLSYRAPLNGVPYELHRCVAVAQSALLRLRPDGPERARQPAKEQIADFRSYGVEVRFRLESGQEFWLVPAYTGRDRVELTPEDLERLATVMEAFPGAEVEG